MTLLGPECERCGQATARLACRPACAYTACMCLICVDFDRGALRLGEARRALSEMRGTLDPTHVSEVEEKLARAEEEEPPASSD